MASGTITSVTGKTLNLVLTWSTARIAGTRTARLIVEAWIEFTSLECAARSSQSMTLAGEAHTFNTPTITDYTGSLHRVEANSYSDGLGYNEKTFSYDANGNLASQTVSASWLFAGTYSGTYLGTITASGTVTFDSIEPANTTLSAASCTSTNLNTAAFSWTATDTCDYVRYYFNGSSTATNVGAVSAKTGTFTKTGLTPNTPYYIYIEVRRADSQLWTKSGKISFTTKAKTTLASISDTTPTIGRNLTYTLNNPSGTTSRIRVYVKDSGGSWGTQVYDYNSAPNSGTLSLSTVKATSYDRAINLASTQYLVRVYCGSDAYYTDYTYNVNMPTSTVSITNANIGSAATVSVSRDDANLTHNITYVFGSGSGTVATGVTTSNSWTTPTSLASKISNAKSGTCTITCTTKHGTATVGSSTATCTLTIPTSSISLSVSSTDMDVSRTLTIGRIYTNLTHDITYNFNGATGTIASAAAASSSWTFPVATLAPKIPNTTSGTGTITCTTKNGTATVGTSFVSFTATVPTSVIPTFTSFTQTELNSAVTTALGVSAARTDNYVKSLSSIFLTIHGAAGAYGSTISTYRITFDGNNQDSATTTARYVPINWSGNKTVSCRITDSRGRTASSGNITISALDYAEPTLDTFTISRCNSSGTLEQMGTYARVNINIGASSLLVSSVEKNTITAKLYSKPKSSSTYALKKTLTGTTSIVSNTYDLSGYLQTTSYDFQLVINDVFNSITKILNMSSSAVVMSWGENGVGIGKIHENGALDVEGDVNVNGFISGTIKDELTVYDESKDVGIRTEFFNEDGFKTLMVYGYDYNYLDEIGLSAEEVSCSGALTASSLKVWYGGLQVIGESEFINPVRVGDQTIKGSFEPYSTSYRSAGMYGWYDSSKTGHIWSMGNEYRIPDDGYNFGNIYGIAYKHTNNTTGGTMAGGHQIVFCSNGTPGAAISLTGNIWTSGNVSALSFTDRTPFYKGDALSEIAKIKGDDKGELIHSTLPEFARKSIISKTLNEELDKNTPVLQEDEEKIIEEGRDLGAMISMLTVAVQQLTEITNKQQQTINELKAQIINKQEAK